MLFDVYSKSAGDFGEYVSFMLLLYIYYGVVYESSYEWSTTTLHTRVARPYFRAMAFPFSIPKIRSLVTRTTSKCVERLGKLMRFAPAYILFSIAKFEGVFRAQFKILACYNINN